MGLDVNRELASLKQRFDTAAGDYEALRTSAEGAVKQWVWATAPCYHLDLLYFLDAQTARGRIAKSPPNDFGGWTAYGFSKANGIVVERIYLSGSDGRYYSTFFFELEDRVIGYHFHYDTSLGCINCAQLIFSDGRPVLYQQWATGGYLSRAFVSTDGRIRSVMELFKERDERQERMSRELRYLDGGRVEVWTKWPGERRPDKTFSGIPPAENPFLRKGAL